MFETSKLRGRIVEKYGSQIEFAKALHGSSSYISQYLNGKLDMNQKTIDKWVKALDIPADEIHIYFFTHQVHESKQKGE